MRLLTNVGVFDEVGEDTYAANAISKHINLPGFTGGEKHQSVSILHLC